MDNTIEEIKLTDLVKLNLDPNEVRALSTLGQLSGELLTMTDSTASDIEDIKRIIRQIQGIIFKQLYNRMLIKSKGNI